MPQSDAQRRAKKKYNLKTYDRLEITVKKGEKQIITDHAQKMGKSLNGFVNDAIKEQMKRDNSDDCKNNS